MGINTEGYCKRRAGGVGARSLNIELQAALNPADDRKVEWFAEATKQRRRWDGPSFANFPVFFPVSREFGAETGSP
jgi:hypothetical protein